MLTSLLLSLVMQLPMSGIINEQPHTKPTIVVQVKKIYVYIDKFNVEHEGEDRVKLRKEVDEANARPFKLQDKSGQWWEHQDKATLENFINTRNVLLGFPQTGYIQPVCIATA